MNMFCEKKSIADTMINYPRNIFVELPKDWPCECTACSMGGGVACLESMKKYGHILRRNNNAN